MTGQVVIREAPLPVEVDAYIEGVIDEVIEEEGVVIKSQGATKDNRRSDARPLRE